MAENFKKSPTLLAIEARSRKKSRAELLAAVAVIMILVVGYVTQHVLHWW